MGDSCKNEMWSSRGLSFFQGFRGARRPLSGHSPEPAGLSTSLMRVVVGWFRTLRSRESVHEFK